MTAVEGARCASCGHVVFPRRLLCPRCGADDWRAMPLGDGLLRQVTVVRRSLNGAPAEPPVIGLVATTAGPSLIVRVDGAVAGDAVRLELEDGAIVARQIISARNEGS